MNFKKLFLSSALFFVTSGYSIAQVADSVKIGNNDLKAQTDTIWDYAYPVLGRPLVLFDDLGQITTFSCSGLYYKRSSADGGYRLGFSESEILTVSSDTEGLWRSAMDDLKSRLGIRDEKILIRLVIKTIAYHCITEQHKVAHGNIPTKEKAFIRNFNSEIRADNLRLNRRGRPYNHAAYLRHQQQSENTR